MDGALRNVLVLKITQIQTINSCEDHLNKGRLTKGTLGTLKKVS